MDSVVRKIELSRNIKIQSKNEFLSVSNLYTAEREVNAMLGLLGSINANITATYLDPACGNGNFLIAILRRKLDAVFSIHPQPMHLDVEFRLLQAAASIHGIDSSEENLEDARARMKAVVIDAFSEYLNTWKAKEGFYAALNYILDTNIQCGDMLNGVHEIVVTEFTQPKRHHFGRARFRMVEMMCKVDRECTPIDPIDRIKSTPYWRLS